MRFRGGFGRPHGLGKHDPQMGPEVGPNKGLSAMALIYSAKAEDSGGGQSTGVELSLGHKLLKYINRSEISNLMTEHLAPICICSRNQECGSQ